MNSQPKKAWRVSPETWIGAFSEPAVCGVPDHWPQAAHIVFGEPRGVQSSSGPAPQNRQVSGDEPGLAGRDLASCTTWRWCSRVPSISSAEQMGHETRSNRATSP